MDRWNSVRHAVNSWALSIVTKPLIVLIILLAVILGTAAATNHLTRNRMLLERERVLREKQIEWEIREADLREKFARDLVPILAERGELKRRLEAVAKKRGKYVAPKSEEDIVHRFQGLGY